MFDKPIVISNLSFDLNEKPLLKLFNCIDERPRSNITVSTLFFKILVNLTKFKL